MRTTDATQASGSPVPAGTPVVTTGRQKAKPSTTFVTQSSDQVFVVMLGRILAGMTANPAYPDPLPPLAEVAAAHDAFVAAVNGNDRGRHAIATRDKARERVEALASDLALYVAQHCRGDLVTLLGSGFPARRAQGAILQIAPPTPERVQVCLGPSSGQAIGRCGRVEGALLYQWRYATVQAPTQWTVTDPLSKTRVTLKDLVRGTEYLVQVRACGRRGCSDWSNVKTVYAV